MQQGQKKRADASMSRIGPLPTCSSRQRERMPPRAASGRPPLAQAGRESGCLHEPHLAALRLLKPAKRADASTSRIGPLSAWSTSHPVGQASIGHRATTSTWLHVEKAAGQQTERMPSQAASGRSPLAPTHGPPESQEPLHDDCHRHDKELQAQSFEKYQAPAGKGAEMAAAAVIATYKRMPQPKAEAHWEEQLVVADHEILVQECPSPVKTLLGPGAPPSKPTP